MKVIKPIRLSVLYKAYSDGQRDVLAVTGMVLMPFSQPSQLVTEPALWKFAAEQLGKDTMLDAAMPKQSGEFVVAGKCYAPGGTQVPAMEVKVKVGAHEKSLMVVGDRQWVQNKKQWEISQPLPFTELELGYANAFGGTDFPRNPLGKGMPPAQEDAPYPLPNIFDPKKPIVSVEDRPEPAGFAPIDFMWPQRFSKAGTYDEAWRKTRFPGYAADMDWSIFNTAQPDQWMPEFLRGDESIEVSGMHPRDRVQRATLPAFAARCFITEKTQAGEEFRAVPMHAETLLLFPNASHMLLIFRGTVPIASDDATSVLHLVAALEDLGQPKPTAHYREVLAQRLDKRKGAAYSMDDNPLMPPGLKDAPPVAEVAEVDGKTQLKGHLEGNQRRKAEKELARGKQEAAAQRAQLLEIARINKQPPPDLTAYDKVLAQTLPPKAAPTRLDQLPQILDEVEKETAAARAAALAQKAEMDKMLRDLCKQQGIDFEKLPKGGPAPRVKAAEAMGRLQAVSAANKAMGVANPELDKLLADPKMAQRLQQAEDISLKTYRIGAQHFSPTDVGGQAQALRGQVLAGLAQGASFAGQDLTGADLNGLDLSNRDFADALMENVNLSNADLSNAKLAGALLAHARLGGAKLAQANFSNANLGKAVMTGVQAQGANFTGAVLDEADLTGADLSDAKLDGAKLASAVLRGARLLRISAPGAHLMDMFNVQPDTPVEEQPGMNLRGLDFSGANLKGAMFMNSQLDGACFKGANLEGATLLGASAAGVDFSGANMVGLRVVMGTRLEGAVFKGANLSRSNFRGAMMDKADLSGATLDSADFCDTSLKLAVLTGANASNLLAAKANFSNARLDRVNFFQAILQKADVAGADMRKSNFFRADLIKLKRDELSLMDGANLDNTLLKEDRHGT
ncbi:Pentapeptide repeat-containing protein [Polaromonas sp. YR568]|uniref:DUF2169 family type VI secretion system accessory protein n=1 Tax=Polaromonas sp. YR568 TaxID=1855301 RepID=UPI0008F02CC7|nr:DUF2169 domain-containing protein [Polaromonas sp. YR568]SFU61540.1 Pentapeptide repeat-containing protein [Polaromonas sp. YR568]